MVVFIEEAVRDELKELCNAPSLIIVNSDVYARRHISKVLENFQVSMPFYPSFTSRKTALLIFDISLL